ncbi:MAG: hypothetical protein PHF50_04365 [Patescibacteria group bacterium]|nr:hypothetical protein [Patescibacteria group bacterium]
MLAQKKISIKKLAIYLSIILFMVSGTGFMLYQNKKLTAIKVTDVSTPAMLDNFGPLPSATTTEDNAMKIKATDNQPVMPGQTLNMSAPNQSGGLDLSIFSSDKFKNLRANIFTAKGAPEIGKRDPFRPN